ncbi:hypothetical protein [Floridanema evergladense]|uniref:DUF86 domain-containing protein n=1 Tax=Floridaenema evergladense BLCC-F167 TaxID=3153639 RepID=A0ABV4WD00_9CYAN
MGNDIRIKRITLGLKRLQETIEEFSEDARIFLDFSDVNYADIWSPNVSDDYEKELIQVAASAVAAVTDSIMNNLPNCSLTEQEIQSRIFTKIQEERKRQDIKFSPMPRKLSPLVWLAVLFEELGEVAKEIER